MQDTQLELFDVEDNKVTLEELFQAYIDCRKHKRKTTNALEFEADFEQNLIELYHEINDGSYCPGKSIAFIVDKPVKREVFAADFRDRVVHHLIINKLLPLLEKEFIHDSYSCREVKGCNMVLNVWLILCDYALKTILRIVISLKWIFNLFL